MFLRIELSRVYLTDYLFIVIIWLGNCNQILLPLKGSLYTDTFFVISQIRAHGFPLRLRTNNRSFAEAYSCSAFLDGVSFDNDPVISYVSLTLMTSSQKDEIDPYDQWGQSS